MEFRALRWDHRDSVRTILMLVQLWVYFGTSGGEPSTHVNVPPLNTGLGLEYSLLGVNVPS